MDLLKFTQEPFYFLQELLCFGQSSVVTTWKSTHLADEQLHYIQNLQNLCNYFTYVLDDEVHYAKLSRLKTYTVIFIGG